MEDPTNENEVTLVLRGSRIKAQKDTLARNSLYFAALFSANFKDHQQKEFDINYDISLTTLQTFVDWVNNEGEHAGFVFSAKYHFNVRVSLKKFLTGSHSELLELLNFSVLFAAEKFTDDITEMIICTRPYPDVMSKVWLLAEDLQLNVLRDIAFASCLDRFEDLSLSCLLTLSKENFFKLVLNRNVHSSSDHVVFVIEEWKKKNGVSNSFAALSLEPSENDNMQAGQAEADTLINAINLPEEYIFNGESTSEVPANTAKIAHKILTSNINCVKKLYDIVRPRYMACAAGRESGDTLFVWAWNGENNEISEIAKMTNSQMLPIDNGKEIVGMQVIGRAFSIYLIGGEVGFGTGRFDTTLWRYCLFSKKFYIETILPRARRHMAVAFLKKKLYLFGGVGCDGSAISSVDVYDIHAGTWSQAADIPKTFAEVPASCVADAKFIYKKRFIYVYDPISDKWKMWDDGEIGLPIQSMLGCGTVQAFERRPALRFTTGRIELVLNQAPEFRLETIPFVRDRTSEPEIFCSNAWRPRNKSMIYQQIWNEPWFVRFGSKESEPYVEAVHVSGKFGPDTLTELKLTKADESYCTFRENTTSVPADCFKYRLGCFNVIDPQTLHHSIDADLFDLCSESKKLHE